jgi:hypothetical protein
MPLNRNKYSLQIQLAIEDGLKMNEIGSKPGDEGTYELYGSYESPHYAEY